AAEAAEALADDALDDLRRDAAADRGRAHADGGRAHRVAAAEAAGGVTDGAHADALAATAAALADARQPQTAVAERVADGAAEHLAARARAVLAPPRRHRRVLAGAGPVEQADDPELRGLPRGGEGGRRLRGRAGTEDRAGAMRRRHAAALHDEDV